MAKLKDLINEFAVAGGVVSRPAFSNIDMGFKTQKSIKLKNIVEDIYGSLGEDIDIKEFVGAVSNYNDFGKQIYREGNLVELAEILSRIATTAKAHTLQETEDWFDKISVNRNMKELTNLSGQFKKVAREAQSLQERMSVLYEDMGHILGRYYEINEDCEVPHRDGDEIDDVDKLEEGTYQDFFQSALKKFGVSSPDELEDEEKSKFFSYIDDNWTSKLEK